MGKISISKNNFKVEFWTSNTIKELFWQNDKLVFPQIAHAYAIKAFLGQLYSKNSVENKTRTL